MPRARIVGTGSYVPERVLSNLDLEKLVDTTDQWITERTGIKERRIAAEGETASDLALKASKAALKAAGVKPGQLDLIIVGTCTWDMVFPSTACFLQAKLGAKNAAGFDLSAACSGFLYSLAAADSFIRSGAAKKVLVVGAEVLSRFTDYQDRTTCILFGDGAGAAVLASADEDRGVLSVDIASDGKLSHLIALPGGGSLHPPTHETIDQRLHFIKMKGNETFKFAVKTLERITRDTLKKNRLKASDISLFIPHQANYRILHAVAERLKLPRERVFMNLEKYGNTSAASIPIALDEAVRTHRVREGDYVLLEAFGGGLTWASALVKW